MRPTITDVAQHAGVSVRTVSRVLNNHPNVSRFTRERVLQAMEELDYGPNALARGLATQESYTIGVIIPDVANPYFAEVVRGVEDTSAEANYHIFLCNTDEEPKREIRSIQLLRQRQVDGLILVSPRFSDAVATKLFANDRRVVAVNRAWSNLGITSVIVDNYRKGREAADILAATKPDCLAYLSGPMDSESNELRWAGFSERASELQLKTMKIDSSMYRIPAIDRGHEAMDQLLSTTPGVVGVFCFNDLMAIGALDAVREHGLSVPRDVRLVGFDDIEMAARVYPPLTTFHTPKLEIGSIAMNCLLEILKQDDDVISKEVIISPKAAIRDSTRCETRSVPSAVLPTGHSTRR